MISFARLGGGGGGGRLGSFAHLWPLVTSYQFVLQTVTKGYRIEFTGNPPGALRSLETRQDARTSNEASSQCWKNERSGKSPSESLRELEWWASRANLTVGRPFLRPDPTMTIVTDASMEGWGGHLGDWVISGQWSSAWAKHHINWLELQAVWLTLQYFLPQVRDTAVDVLTDNSTTVAYINKEGGTQSPNLCYLALDLWAWCRQHGIYLVANHISGVTNVLADALSSGKHNHPT